MTWIDAVLLLAAGLFTGIINTLAGGGSLITLPLFIFLGLPSSEANASNRIGVFLSSIVAVGGFKSKGISVYPYSIWVSISAFVGCVIGAYFAMDIESHLFNRILAIVMVVVITLTVFKPYLAKREIAESFTTKNTVASIIIFFFLGIYGGFIQAGVGLLDDCYAHRNSWSRYG